MKPRSFFLVLSGVVLVLFLLGAGGAYWLASSQVSPQQKAAPQGAMFVPRQAAAVVLLLTNPDRLGNFWLTGAADRRQFQADLHQMQQDLFGRLGLDYERDVQAWLGDEVTFAVATPDLNRDATDGAQPGYLLALSIADSEQAQQAVSAFWQRRAAAKDLILEPFAGVSIIHAVSKKAQSNLASAMVGNQFVLFANDPKVLRDALNNVQVPELNLEHSFVYQQALEQFSQPHLGLVFANFAQFGAWLSDSPLAAALSGVAEAAHRYEGLVAALKSEPQGLLADMRLLSAGSQPQVPVLVDVHSVLQFIPASSRLTVAGQDLQQFWANWGDQIAGLLAQLPAHRPLAALQQDIDLAAADGKFAIAQTGSSDWTFVAERSANLLAGLSQFDQTVQQRGASVGSLELDQQKIYAWTKLKTTAGTTPTLQAEVQGVHTTVGSYEIFATSLAALQQSISAHDHPAASIDAAVTQLPSPNQGYLQLDQTVLKQLLRRLKLPDSVLNSVQSAVLSSYDADEMGLRSVAYLRLQGL